MFTNKKLFKQFLGLLLFNLLLCNVYSQSTIALIPKKGLHVTTNGLPWLTGSEISFFTPDKKHHHYFFTWWEQDADTLAPGRERLLIGSRNTAVNGVYEMDHKGDSVTTHIACQWNYEQPGVADIVFAKLWLPFFSEAVFSTSFGKRISEWNTFRDSLLFIKTPFGEFKITSSQPFQIKEDADLQPGEKDFGRRSQFIVLYENNIPVTKISGIERFFSVQINAVNAGTVDSTVQISPEQQPVHVAWQPHNQQAVLLPQPRFITYLKGNYIIPEERQGSVIPVVNTFRTLLKYQWQLGEKYFPVISAIENKKLPIEGYTISIAGSGVSIHYNNAAGLQHALHTLVQLVRNENGKLLLPFVKITDQPSVSWRGIHMFTGPASWALHRKMYDRVLFPLKMNKVVLQCEQAQWKSRPELHNGISVPMNDLKKEFDYLRANNNEAIPLIQSLGHMEWFFKPKQNRKLAINPDYPYTINPNLKEGREAVLQLWNEAFALLRPQTMHIGFDEIGMIGFHLPREKEVELFKAQIDFLHKYARGKRAELMIWCDMGLGPGEGPDALNGITVERAAAIRSFVPAGTYVADWHYINNANPELYKTNLRIWKNNKNIPIASPWLWPNNVYGFVKAAIDEKTGVLQTTWADFESSEKNMLLNIEQFGAYILALDYAWSGRKELPEQLPYHPVEEWAKRFYSQAKPIASKAGFKMVTGFQLRDISKYATRLLPDTVILKTGIIESAGYMLNAETTSIVPEGTVVAEIHFMNGTRLMYTKQLRYGAEVRAASDKRMLFAGGTGNKEQIVDFFSNTIHFNRIVIINRHPASGLTAKEWILFTK